MDLGDTNTAAVLVCAIALVVGICGIVVPLLPGLILCWGGVLLWAFLADGGAGKWVVLGIATVFVVVGTVVKYAWPGRNLKRSGVPTTTLLLGGLLGIVGFFVVPVVGLPLGFILGVWLAERARLKDSRLAWPSTKEALKATGLSMLIELAAGLAVAATWLVGLLVV